MLKGTPEDNNVPHRTGIRQVTGKNKGVPSHKPIMWTEEHQRILERLIDCLVEPRVLGFPDFSKPFVLHTDASNQGLGAVLYQLQDEKFRVIAYSTWTLQLLCLFIHFIHFVYYFFLLLFNMSRLFLLFHRVVIVSVYNAAATPEFPSLGSIKYICLSITNCF